MAKSLSILFVSSELYPFAKETGIGDVAYSLPLALKELGHDIRVIFPKYGIVSERKNKIHEISRLRDIPINIGDRLEYSTVKSSTIFNPKAKVQIYVVTNPYFFGERRGVYHDPVSWDEYPDNVERFIFFNRSVIETCNLLGWFPDIIHCNDWQSALTPALARTMYPSKFRKTKFVFTLHNFYRQGAFPLSAFDKTNLEKDILQNFKHKNQFNFVKGGIHYSNYITTVSRTYADEILSDKKYGNGLNVVLKEKSEYFKGILNGIDTHSWNPKSDGLISTKLNKNFDDYKTKNKIDLTAIFGFEYKPGVPLFGLIPRIGYQKGTSLLVEAADELFKNDIQILLLGQGDEQEKVKIAEISQKYPDKFKIKFIFDDDLSHKIEAGCDFFVMPSQYEPCGLNLMYSLTYGTVPIVRATGGMMDVAKDFNQSNKNGNAIVFNDFTADDFIKAVFRGIELYKDKEQMSRIIANGMIGDYSWTKAAAEYANIYKMVIKDNS
jgi:starch synthase